MHKKRKITVLNENRVIQISLLTTLEPETTAVSIAFCASLDFLSPRTWTWLLRRASSCSCVGIPVLAGCASKLPRKHLCKSLQASQENKANKLWGSQGKPGSIPSSTRTNNLDLAKWIKVMFLSLAVSSLIKLPKSLCNKVLNYVYLCMILKDCHMLRFYTLKGWLWSCELAFSRPNCVCLNAPPKASVRVRVAQGQTEGEQLGCECFWIDVINGYKCNCRLSALWILPPFPHGFAIFVGFIEMQMISRFVRWFGCGLKKNQWHPK